MLPFDCDVPAGSRARRLGKFNNILISESDEVNTTLKGCTPYLYRTTQPGQDRLTATDVTVSINTAPECSDSIRGTFSNIEAVKGQRVLSHASQQAFVERTGEVIPAFSGYLDYDKEVNISIYAYQRKDRKSEALGEVLAPAWTLAAESADQLAAEDLDAFLDRLHDAAAGFTLHASEEALDEAAEQLEEAIKDCRRALIPRRATPWTSRTCA